MIKYIFLMISIFTLCLNIFLTYYLIRNNADGVKSYKRNKEVVSFDLSYNELNSEEAKATAILDTEVMVESNKELQEI